MSFRLLKILIPEEKKALAVEVLEEHGVAFRWCSPAEEGRIVVDALIPSEGNEPILDDLQEQLDDVEGARLVLLPVEATIPRIDEDDEEASEGEPATAGEKEKSAPARINREELYTDMAATARTSRYYLTMVGLSAVVASVGLLMGDTAVIIGAMVIAPLLGPNMALAFSTTLGDLKLGRAALSASASGAAVAFTVSALTGLLLTVDPTAEEIASRTQPGFGHLVLALAAGAAGALALTRGISEGLVGVMVAVALLPPLAAAGLLIGDGQFTQGGGALLLVAANVACVNLAGIGSFLAQGIRPLSWGEEKRAKQSTTIAIALWTGLVAALALIIWLTLGD